jgi:hypothetical protein
MVAFFWTRALSRGRAAAAGSELPAASLPEESLYVPKIDHERLRTLVADQQPVDRVVLETAALELLLPEVRKLTARHYETLGEEELTAERCAALAADPATARGRAFFARGRVDSIRKRTREGSSEVEHIGRLRLEDDALAYFLVLDAPEEAGFVRVDGLFLKNYSAESDLAPGTWLEGPLLVGSTALRSYPDLGKVETPLWDLYATIPDADLSPADGSQPRIVRECPFEPYWHLMAYARDLPPDSSPWGTAPELDERTLKELLGDPTARPPEPGRVPWAQAPELDARLVAELLDHPAQWRAQPMRVTLCRVLGSQVSRVGENPARIERVTDGWLGHDTWKNVLHFQAPFALPGIRTGDLVEGRGFFLNVAAYESQGRGLRVAPVIVLSSLSEFTPPAQTSLLRLGLLVSGAFVASIALFAWLLFRDRRRAQEFEQELARRRRARRGSMPNPS